MHIHSGCICVSSHLPLHAAPDDYIHPMGGVWTTFAPTDNLKTINISITDDSRLESTESFYVSLALPPTDQVGLQIGDPATATVTITDDDSKHNLHIHAVYGNENHVILHMHLTTFSFSILFSGKCTQIHRCYGGISVRFIQCNREQLVY